MNRRELLKSSFLTCGAAAASNALGSWFPHAVLADSTTPTVPIVETSLGKVRGAFQNGVYSFKGIHHGASTEGQCASYLPRLQNPGPVCATSSNSGRRHVRTGRCSFGTRSFTAICLGLGAGVHVYLRLADTCAGRQVQSSPRCRTAVCVR